MGCGASSVNDDQPPVEHPSNDETVPRKQDAAALIRQGSGPLTSRPPVWQGLPPCEVPPEPRKPLCEFTDATKGPRKKGIYIRPSPRTRIRLLFLWPEEPPETVKLEIKEMDNVDDLRKDWKDDPGKLPGVFYTQNIANNAVLAAMAPSKFMYRWNVGGVRCRDLNMGLQITGAMADFLEGDGAMGIAALKEVLVRSADDSEGKHPYDDEGGEELLQADLAALRCAPSPRDLPDRLGVLKQLMVGVEDSYLYNMFEVAANVEHQIGYFKRHGNDYEHETTLKEKVLMKGVEVAQEKRDEALQFAKDRLKETFDDISASAFALVGMNREEVLPLLDDKVNAAIDECEVCLKGLAEELEESEREDDADEQQEWIQCDRSPAEFQKRVEDIYYTKRTEVEAVSEAEKICIARYPILIPQYWYDVQVYIVFPKDTENTFRKAVLTVWEDQLGRQTTRRFSMKPYWTGRGVDMDGDTETSEDYDGGENDEEDEGDEDRDDEDSDEGSGDDEDEEPRWRGFHCTVPVIPGRVYSYRIVIDRKTYLTSTCVKSSRSVYHKRFKLSIEVRPWAINPLQELGVL